MFGIDEYTFAIGVGLIFGTAALWLISRELGRRTRVSRAGQILLFCALGTGVFSVAAKAVIVGYLTRTNMGKIAETGLALRHQTEDFFTFAGKTQDVPPTAVQGFRRQTWRALPHRAPGPSAGDPPAALVALGEKLFFDRNLSLDRTISCASCHDLQKGGDDGLRYSVGVDGQLGDRNAPTVLNAAFLKRLFWDGRAASLEAQALGPFVNPVEMAMPSLDAVVHRVRENPGYEDGFARAFGPRAKITSKTIAAAIAAYERTLITPNTPYDRFVRGEDGAMSQQQLRGMALFSELGCRNCHTDPVFSAAGTVRGTGIYRRFPVFAGNPLVARHDLLIEGQPGFWRVPSLRNVANTAPYFHNGSVDTLEEAIRIMAVSQLGKQLSNDPAQATDVLITSVRDEDGQSGRNITLLRDRALTEADVSDIAAFLTSLSGQVTQQVSQSARLAETK